MLRNANKSLKNIEVYHNLLIEFMNNKGYGTVTFYIQNGNITGVDVNEKYRIYTANSSKRSENQKPENG